MEKRLSRRGAARSRAAAEPAFQRREHLRGTPHSVRGPQRPYSPNPHKSPILGPMPEITARLSTALADRYKIESHLGEGDMAF